MTTTTGPRIIVTGSRDWTNRPALVAALLTARGLCADPRTPTLVHGAAPGADDMAASWATLAGWNVEPHPAAWDTRGRGAGMIRNSEMVNAGAQVCVALIRNQSRGATGCAELARAQRIPVIRVEVTDA